MIIDSQQNNAINLALEAQEVVYFRGDLLRGRSFGIPWLPPFPFGSPLARLLAGCYFMNRTSYAAQQRLLQLNGDSGLGRFQVITLASEDRYFVNPRYLAAFSFSTGGGMHTQLSRLLSPSCWGIHHPLPVVVNGPGQLVIYAENLYSTRDGSQTQVIPAGAQAEFIPSQVVAFNCRQSFQVKALHPDDSPLSQVINALIDDNRICFALDAEVYVSPINHPYRHKLRVFLHVAFHLALIPAIVYVLAH
jgi:hypothetical protein